MEEDNESQLSNSVTASLTPVSGANDHPTDAISPETIWLTEYGHPVPWNTAFPLLTVPDAIAWCWARGGAWRERIQPVVRYVRVLG